MREYGGYLELEHNHNREYHADALALNLARNALCYLVRARGIQKLLLPDFLCGSVQAGCRAGGAVYEEYAVSPELRPLLPSQLAPDTYVYLVDYYGTLPDTEVQKIALQCGNRLILDRVQAFFTPPCPGVDTLYSCRKYFGVPDGAYLFTDARLSEPPVQDASAARFAHLLGRFEAGGSACYADYTQNETLLDALPLRAMSPLTHNLLRGVDYAAVQKAREENWAVLEQRLAKYNALALAMPAGPYAYPLLLLGGAPVRTALQKRGVYVPTLWPDVLHRAAPQSAAHSLAENILPLPLDQRYTPAEMHALCDAVEQELLRR